MARRTVISSRLASALAAACLWAIPGVSDAADGTIHFTGSIVEPSYRMQIAPTATVSAGAAPVAGSEVIFSSSRQSAKVSVASLGNVPLTVQCSGRATTPIAGCQFDRFGGTLSIAMKSAPPVGVRPGAVVTVTYE